MTADDQRRNDLAGALGAELVTATEIAAVLGVTRAAVSNWRNRHQDSLPDPIGRLGARDVYYWPDIRSWWIDRQRMAR